MINVGEWLGSWAVLDLCTEKIVNKYNYCRYCAQYKGLHCTPFANNRLTQYGIERFSRCCLKIRCNWSLCMEIVSASDRKQWDDCTCYSAIVYLLQCNGALATVQWCTCYSAMVHLLQCNGALATVQWCRIIPPICSQFQKRKMYFFVNSICSKLKI